MKVGKQILERLKSNEMKEPWIYYIHLEDLHEKIMVPTKYNIEEYGKTKYKAEQIYRLWQEEDPDERTLVIIRPTVVFLIHFPL